MDSIEQRVPPSHEILNQVSEEIPVTTIPDKAVQSLVDDLFAVARGRQGDAQYPTLVGLAAPQIGIAKRVVLIGMNSTGAGEQPQLQEFINPQITSASAAQEEGREGCFSTGRVCGIVKRASEVTVSAYDRNGTWFEHTFQGFPARIAQHEIDHLDGVRFPDRITDDTKLHWVEEHEFGDYRKKWRTWPAICPRSRWEAIKLGNA